MRLWEKSAPSLDCSCIQVRHWCASCQKKALQLCTPFFVRFYCRCGLHSRERMGFIAFQIKAARQVTCVCVHTVCARAGIAAPPLCLCWPQKWMCSCAATGEVCGSSVSSGKGKLSITLLTFHRKLRKILSSSNVLPNASLKKKWDPSCLSLPAQNHTRKPPRSRGR